MRALMFVAFSAAAVAHAQPADPPNDQALAQANELYKAATQAMTEERYAEAARDFTAAYEISKDPVLFFKIGSAHEKAGDCATALTFYKRYLAEAKPEPQYVELTNDRIDACAPPEPAPASEPESAPPAEPTPPPAPVVTSSRSKDGAWLLVGGALAFVTAGAVLAYSAESSEQDVRDLYVGLGGVPPEFNNATRERYDALVDEGERYQYLSWASFGVATGCAIGATILFLRARGEERDEPRVSVTPVITPRQAGMTGVAATVRF